MGGRVAPREGAAVPCTWLKLTSISGVGMPSSGGIFVDDQPLARMRADEWREHVAGAFQDFFRFEFRARHTVGLGDVPRVDDEPAVVTAIGRAGADDVVTRLTDGLETQLGPTWPGGVDVSFGQWQKLALARGDGGPRVGDHLSEQRPVRVAAVEVAGVFDASRGHAV